MTAVEPLFTAEISMATLSREDDVDGAVSLMAGFVLRKVPAASVAWRVAGGEADLFDALLHVVPAERRHDVQPGSPDAGSLHDDADAALPGAPPAFMQLAGSVLLHADGGRFALMYRLLERLGRTPGLLGNPADEDVAKAEGLAKAVRREKHKMTAFVRFRAVKADDGAEAFVAWFEPEHHVLRATAPFFARRFANMRWSILTPGGSAHWDMAQLCFGDGALKMHAPDGDRLEDVWRTYYASIFNPARLKVKAMTAEMPRRYWRNLPEAELISPLIREARTRSHAMVAAEPTETQRRIPAAARYAHQIAEREDSMPNGDPAEQPATLHELKDALNACRRCDLHACATQAVPGAGPLAPDIMFVGEQPGDQEDLSGKPFVGPAGQLLDTALQRVGVDRARCYVTNAVKHFKFEPRGKRRIHKTPSVSEVQICRWWIDQERAIVRPRAIVALGATAARAVLGHPVQPTKVQGQVLRADDGTPVIVATHPAYLLRLTKIEDKRAAWNAFLDALRLAAGLDAEASGGPEAQGQSLGQALGG